jgi:two-component sensor histidine kinase
MASMVELREHNARQKILLDELNHRVKNSLASVQSIALQTLKGSADLEQFRETFQSRLIALSKTHELLVSGRWTSVALSALIRQHLDHYGRRYVIEGQDLLLSPNYTLSLGLALHELATNALKYGAWSKGDLGVITVDVREAGGDMFELTWTEHGGPAASDPKRKGFGSRLLKSVGSEMGGDVVVEYRPSGLMYVVRISRSDSALPLSAAEPA